MVLPWIMLFGLCVALFTETTQGFFISTPGKMTPVNPIVELGNYIELNCTLTGDVGPFNSSHLYFQAGSQVISSEFYTILSPTIMQYRENMTGQYTGKYPFYCYLNQSTNTNEGPTYPKLIGSQVAKIGKKPEASRNITARFNYWNHGDVYWQPVQRNVTFVFTSTKVTYSWIHGLRPYECDEGNDVSRAVCTCTKNHCHFSRIPIQKSLYLFIENSNIFGTVKSTHTIDIDSNIVPLPVVSVSGNVKGIDSVNISWVPTVEEHPLRPLQSVYRVLYRTIYSSEPWRNAGETEKTWLLVEGLQPNQGYTFNVSVKVNYRESTDPNAWSDSKQTIAITDKDSSGCPPCLPCMNECLPHVQGSGATEMVLGGGYLTDWKRMSSRERSHLLEYCKQETSSLEQNLEEYTACVLGEINKMLP